MNMKDQEPAKINWEAVESIHDVVSILRLLDIRITPEHDSYHDLKNRGLLDIKPDTDSMHRDQAREFAKCFADPVYFAENYFTIHHYHDGIQKPALTDWQIQFILDITCDCSGIVKIRDRQEGKSLALSIAVLWILIFGRDEHIGYVTQRHICSHFVIQKLGTAIRALPSYFGGESIRMSKDGIYADDTNVHVVFMSSHSNLDIHLRGISWTRFFMDEHRYYAHGFFECFNASTQPISTLKQIVKISS